MHSGKTAGEAFCEVIITAVANQIKKSHKGKSFAKKLEQPGLINNGNTQFLGLCELGAGIFTGNEIMRFFTDAAADLSTFGFDPGSGFFAFQVGQSAGENEGLICE